MKKRLSRQVKVGIFGLSMAVLLYLGINYIKSKRIFSNDDTYYIEYSSANGLEVSSPVLIKGFRVGTVNKIKFDIKNSTVIAEISVNNNYPLPSDSKAKVTSASLLGGKVIEIILGKSDKDLQSGAHITPEEEPELLAVVGDEYEKLKQMATTLVSQLNNALTGINLILSSDNIENITSTLKNLNQVSENVNNIIIKERLNIEDILVNIKKLSDGLNKELPKIGATMDDLNTISALAAAEAPNLLRNASSAINNLNDVLAKISNSEGSIGKLLSEDEFYNNLNGVTDALTALLTDLKANPKRYINISVFGGGNKEKKQNKEVNQK